MRASILAVLATLLFAGTAFAHEQEDFEYALGAYISEMTLLQAYTEEYLRLGDDMLVQEWEVVLNGSLDRLEQVVVQSCYEDWHRLALTSMEMLALSTKQGREGDINGALATNNAGAGLRELEFEHRVSAVRDCAESEGLEKE